MDLFKQLGPVPEYPKRPNELRPFVLQAHFRGKSVHLDFRASIDQFAEGWTISAMQEGAVQVPVVTLSQAQKVAGSQETWKFDLETGLIFPRKVKTKIRGESRTVIRPGSLFAERKAQLIPKEWLEIEGRTGWPPDWPKTVLTFWDSWPEEVKRELRSEGFTPEWAEQALREGSWDVQDIPVGATRAFPGVLVIMDQGTLTLGARKPYFFEYFPHERKLLPGRIVFRLVARVKSATYAALLKEQGALVLEPGVEEETPRTAGYWVYSTPDPLPYVLSDEALDKGWLPPKGVAALPYDVMKAAPPEMRYWEMGNEDERKEAREKMIEWYEGRAKKSFPVPKASRRFKLFEQTYKGPVVIRFGPSTLLYWFLIDEPRLVLSLENSPLLRSEIAGIEAEERFFQALWDEKDFEPEPGTLLNPTKETPSRIRLIDEGQVSVLEEEPGFLRLKLAGSKLSGYFNIVWEDPDSPFVTFMRAKEIQAKQELRAVLQKHSWPGGRHWDLRLEYQGKLLEFHFEEDPGLPPQGRATFSECSDLSWLEISEPSWKEGTFVEPLSSWTLVWEEVTPGYLEFFLDGIRFQAKNVDGTWEIKPSELGSEQTFLTKYANDEEQVVYGVVLSPFPDAHGDVVPPEEIRKAAHRFLAFGREIGLHHEGQPIEAHVVESFIAPHELRYENGATVFPGEWVLAVHLPDRELWERVKQGEFMGFSIQGWGLRESLS